LQEYILHTGDVGEDGLIFSSFKKDGIAVWQTPAQYHRHKIVQAKCRAKKRAGIKGVPFDLTTDYLESIYPKDSICPVLKIPMIWGSEDFQNNSPSLDRIHPAIGYIPGNVMWISNRANKIKNDATVDELVLVADFYKDLLSCE
jgi:hypothetical protein